jgi:hypothetical protein
MTYNKETGYKGKPFEDYMQLVMEYVNKRTGSTYIMDDFVQTNYYSAYYPLVQVIMQQDNNFSLIWEKLNDFISVSNESINDPKITKNSLIDAFLNYQKPDAAGKMQKYPIKVAVEQLIDPTSYIKSINDWMTQIIAVGGRNVTKAETEEKYQEFQNIQRSAGNMRLCLDISDYNTISKEDICKILYNYTPYGLAYIGEETYAYNLSNGDKFTYRWRLPIFTNLWLKIDIKIDRNNVDVPIDSVDMVKTKLNNNLNNIYKIGLDFEPDKYLSVDRDLKWAGQIVFNWSKNPNNLPIGNINDWSTGILYCSYRDRMVFNMDNSRTTVNIS